MRPDERALPDKLIQNYLKALVGKFFKILAMKDAEEQSLDIYLYSLQGELMGFQALMVEIGYNARFLSLLSILQYLITYDCNHQTVKREIFKAIDICKKLEADYGGMG